MDAENQYLDSHPLTLAQPETGMQRVARMAGELRRSKRQARELARAADPDHQARILAKRAQSFDPERQRIKEARKARQRERAKDPQRAKSKAMKKVYRSEAKEAPKNRIRVS
ncbi:uncharacterized protein BDZ99DRAFT_475492 [Mytilinidion resinicola]|uniref:Uncharacterized protein n=1 Tax=Mytilinidion resinicola TaxID=574789 RepID=A0A6A6YNW9_9PEZI|nr:uncharacterized protein BDZ99DRAFT_475492 [Mytilinidion resinicola]KAF2810572.1 hypothetical protein BDZ99DRAFT_475492 [Mytilinidion resinicola]